MTNSEKAERASLEARAIMDRLKTDSTIEKKVWLHEVKSLLQIAFNSALKADFEDTPCVK